jgi:histidine triad (HIT) family protein
VTSNAPPGRGEAEPDCLFCRVVAGEIPAEPVAESAAAIAIRDIAPQAPTHILIVPRAHHRDVVSLVESDSDAALAVLRLAAEVADAERLTGGHRWVINTGADGGQTVDHVHLHLLGGRALRWPPG